MHESLDDFKFRPDTTTNFRVICPCASEKLMYNVVNTLAPLFFIGSSSYWQVMRTSITSRTSSKFGQIGPRAAELAALERLEKSPWETSCEHSSSFIFESINLILAGKENIHESLDEFKLRPNTTTNTRGICPYTSEKFMYNVVNTLAPLFLIGSSSFLQVRRTTINSWTSSKFDQIGLWTAELAALERLEKTP